MDPAGTRRAGCPPGGRLRPRVPRRGDPAIPGRIAATVPSASGRIVYITRTWFSENERRGFMACTPAGYRLVGLAGWIGALGWLQFLVLIALLILSAATRLFRPPSLWLFASPIAFGVVAQLLDVSGRSLARRRQFTYQYEPDLASWLEGGARRTYPPQRDGEAATTGSSGAP